MSEKAFLIDAVAQFLQSSEWLDAVNAFLETHFRKFLAVATRDDETKDVPDDAKRASAAVSGDRDNEDDGDAKSATQSYSLEQYETFLLFKDLVERLLEQVIADLGCSGDDLVSVLEESARLGSHASSERQFFIKTLLSFERYGAFHRKIGQFAAEKRGATVDASERLGSPTSLPRTVAQATNLCASLRSLCSKWRSARRDHRSNCSDKRREHAARVLGVDRAARDRTVDP